jgi:uncharacterized protein (TIGR00369 family)
MAIKTFEPKVNNTCFGCGGANAEGLKLTFTYDDDSGIASAQYTPESKYSGGNDILHGGIIATLLDEASSKVLSGMEKKGMTRNLNVEYLKPIEVGKEILIQARCEKVIRHKYFIHSEIFNEDKILSAKADALFIVFK